MRTVDHSDARLAAVVLVILKAAKFSAFTVSSGPIRKFGRKFRKMLTKVFLT